MEIRVLFKIHVTSLPGDHPDGLWEGLNKFEAGEGLFTFEAALPPPIGTIMHFWPPAVARAIDETPGFRKGAATKVAQHYLNWEVVEHADWWNVGEDGRLFTVIDCTGQPYARGVGLLDYEDLIDRDMFPKRDDETR